MRSLFILVGLGIGLGILVYLFLPGGGPKAAENSRLDSTASTTDAGTSSQKKGDPSSPQTAEGADSGQAKPALADPDNAGPGSDDAGSSAGPAGSPGPSDQPDQLSLTGEDDRPEDVPRFDGTGRSTQTHSNSQAGQTSPGRAGDSADVDAPRSNQPQGVVDSRPSSSPPASGLPTVTKEDLSDRAGRRAREGMRMLSEGRLVGGRAILSQLLFKKPTVLSDADSQAIRNALAKANEKLVFSPRVYAGDPLAQSYKVQPGDTLGQIGKNYDTPYKFLERINQTKARRLQAGQRIKVIKGPFHALIDKSAFRLDLLLTGPNGQRLYVRSYKIGLGKNDSTPIGQWRIKPGKKVINPSWRNPRTGEFFGRDDPKNPIGEYWLALQGTESRTETRQGYGIHGTIEPNSIGQQSSMGCVRLHSKDIEQLFHILDAGDSKVEIQP